MNDYNTAGLLEQTTRIVSTYLNGNQCSPGELVGLIKDIYSTLSRLSSGDGSAASVSTPASAKPAAALQPAVPIARSVNNDYIVCLEDGKKVKMLRRYLKTHYSMTPEDYRKRWGLPRDYPMVAPAYARKRSDLAKKIGLGKNSPNYRRKGRKRAAA